jgi:hypothetical protein
MLRCQIQVRMLLNLWQAEFIFWELFHLMGPLLIVHLKGHCNTISQVYCNGPTDELSEARPALPGWIDFRGGGSCLDKEGGRGVPEQVQSPP